ncbi:MAG: DUF2147 domain-containing protein [Bacteroidales bacterium]|nr:DUF2147 domain-containing protein [Bacteroidales bacterium]
MKKQIVSLLGVILFILPFSLMAQKDIVGVWKTIDDDGVTEKSFVQIYKEGKYYKGKIIDIVKVEDKKNVCDECDEDDPRYNKPIIGMVIIEKLEKVGDNEWDEGQILDPKSGDIYDCKMYIDSNGDLVVRGYMGWSLIGRSQLWKKQK